MSNAQSESDIYTITEFTDDIVKLRWMPTGYALWQEGIKHGYKIERIEDASQTKIILAEGLKPISAADFDNQFPTNNSAKSAKMMLYDLTINTAPAQSNSLKDVVEIQEQNDGRFLFAMVAAENDFAVAKAMALGFEDDQVDPNLTYSYIITIDDEEVMASVQPGFGVPDFSGVSLEPVNSLITNLDSDVAVLSWDVKDFERVYSSWNIERSIDGIQFEKINTTPFMHGYTEDAYEYVASYQDPLGDCNGKLFYRVQGITPFGSVGPYSNETSVACVNKRIRIPFAINGSEEKGDNILINWRTFDPVYEDSIKGFNIYRTPEMTQAVVKLNDNLLSNKDREFMDKDALPSGYYFLEIIDINGTIHRSSEFFVQRKDEVPPAIPTGVTGRFVSEQTLQLKWQRNKEPDFKGCDIVIANDRNANYIKKNVDYITGASFNITFNEQLITDSIFVKIRSLDNFYNPSEYSKIYAFPRPDVWAPSNPIMEFAYPTPQGVALGWTYSGSDDATKHKVQRKYENDYKWKDLLIISKENVDKFQQTITVAFNDSRANHIDNYELETRAYNYRIVASDKANNTSYSKVLSVVPFSTQSRDLIKNFKVQIFKQDISPSNEMIAQLSNLGSPQINEQIASLTETTFKANLTWTCELTENVDGFIIYRSMPKEGFKPIKECSVAEALGLEDMNVNIEGNVGRKQVGFLDENLKKGYRYSYFIVAKFSNGAESARSKIITKTTN